MQCSSPIPISRGIAVPSPSSFAIASANGNVLEIRDIETLFLLHSITTSGTNISQIVWSPTSDILAAASIPSNSVVIVNPTTGAVLADVHDSPLPIANISLSSNGVLLISAVHSIAISLFSVHRAKVLAVIPFVNHRSLSIPIYSWSPCSRFIAIATRKDGIHGISVVNLASGNIVISLKVPEQLPGISELAGFRWLPSGNLLVWGGPLDPLNDSAVTLISPSGNILSRGTFAHTEHDQFSRMIASEEYKRRLSVDTDYGKKGLGIKSLAVNLKGSLLAVGGYDGRLRIINVAKWRIVKCFGHDCPEISSSAPPVIFRERTEDERDSDSSTENDPPTANVRKPHGSKSGKPRRRPRRSYFQVLDTDGGVEITKRVRSANAPGSNSFGISCTEFSPDGKFLASKSDKAGNVVFIWDVVHLALSAVMILEHDIRTLRWNRHIVDGQGEYTAQLGISCGEEFVYIWRQSGAAAVAVRGNVKWQTPFKARKIAWSHDNSALVVADGISANAFMTVYVAG